MRICGLEKFSLVDFDGKLACTVFTAGCNFACPFCHNSPLVVDAANQAEISEEELFTFLASRKKLLDAVCVSGGEPTLYKDLPDLIAKIKALGYAVKLDSNGTNPFVLKHLIDEKLIDYVAMDVKNCLDKYSVTVNKSSFEQENIKKSVELLMQSNIGYEFRTTLVEQFHTESDIVKIRDWLSGADKYFLQRFVDSESCIAGGLSPVPLETALKFKDILSAKIERVALRGY